MGKLLQVGVPVNSRKGVFEELMKMSVEKLSMDVKVQFIRDMVPIVLLYVLEVMIKKWNGCLKTGLVT